MAIRKWFHFPVKGCLWNPSCLPTLWSHFHPSSSDATYQLFNLHYYSICKMEGMKVFISHVSSAAKLSTVWSQGKNNPAHLLISSLVGGRGQGRPSGCVLLVGMRCAVQRSCLEPQDWKLCVWSLLRILSRFPHVPPSGSYLQLGRAQSPFPVLRACLGQQSLPTQTGAERGGKQGSCKSSPPEDNFLSGR